MNALGMIEVYSFTTALCVADLAAKTADVKIIAFDRNRPKSADAPAPLVMVVKIEGSVAAVRAAVDAGVAYAKGEGKFIVSHIIPRPAEHTEKMGYLMDINKDKYNKKLPKNFIGVPEAEIHHNGSFGILEVQGLVASIEGLDAMLKASEVRLIHTEKRLGGRLVTLIVTGSVSAVKAALESGIARASALGEIFGTACIARPHNELLKFFDLEV
ncbi:MAG: BMC domain-containing protein [Clostridia bacterium]|nr:BMC domain-containing protein [Clostridia bacterium]